MSFTLDTYSPQNVATARSNCIHLASHSTQQCRLYADILDLILYHHRNDAYTLAQCARVSHGLLHISRKLLYRSVSLDYCENPYGYEQQLMLRVSLASHPHLCRYIHELRVNLSTDPLLAQIMNQVTRVEKVHVIGGGGGEGGVPSVSTLDEFSASYARHDPATSSSIATSASSSSPAAQAPPPPATAATALDSHHRPLNGTSTPTPSAAEKVQEALQRVFGLPSLSRVTLENVFPFSETYLACFDRRLEVLQVLATDPFAPVRVPARRGCCERGVCATTAAAASCSTLAGRDRVRLDNLVVNIDRLSPFLGLVEASGHAKKRLDLTQLKQAHLYIWDSNDGDAPWALVESSKDSLEYLTLSPFHSPSNVESLSRCTGFPHLQTLVLSVPTFSATEDPFRGLVHLFITPNPSSTSSPFPSLRTLKISFDLWAVCAGNATARHDITAYRGWYELDEAIHRALGPQTAIVFEVQCNPRYKVPDACLGEGEEGGLLTLIKSELYNLRHNPNFTIV